MSKVRRVPKVALVAVAAMVLSAAACRNLDRLLEHQEPEVDPRQVFQAFQLATRNPGEPDEPGQGSGTWSFSPCEGWAGEAGSRMRLGGLFSAELPPEEGWTRAESSGAAILVRYRPGSSLPSAYLYAEEIGQGASDTGFSAFLGKVDQRFELSTFANLTEALATLLGEETGQASQKGPAERATTLIDGDVPAGGLEPTKGPAETNSVGQGEETSKGAAGGSSESENRLAALESLRRGYSSKQESFSGWKWLGTCAPPRSFSTPDEVSPVSGLDSFRGNRDRLAPALMPFLRLSRSHGAWRLQPAAASRPAFQILATVTLPDHRDEGVHLVIGCIAVPRCEDAPALARILGSIRVAPLAGGAGGGGRDSDTLRELGLEVGLSLSE